MRVAAILVCAITAVFGNAIELEIDLDEQGCPVDHSISKIFPHTYCNMFNLCSNGHVIQLRCSGNLLFNIDTLECDWSYNVDCAGRNISDSTPEENEPEDESEVDNDTCNCDPAEAPEICSQDGSDGVLVAHEYCTRFYKCSGGRPVALRCPKTLTFNPYKNRCDWAENVDCGNRTMPETDDDEVIDGQPEEDEDDSTGPGNDDPAKAAEICAETESNGVLVAHEYCNWYYTCWNGQPIAMKCPVDLVFNARRNRCDWNSNVDCGNRTISEPEENDNGDGQPEEDEDDSTGPGNDDPAKAAEICAETESNGVLVAHEYCNWYYTCWDGQPIAMKCPVDLVFNARRNRCDWNSNVDCGNRTISEPEENDNGDGQPEEDEDDSTGPGNDDPAKAAEICAETESNGVLVAHEYCNWYYTCWDGQPIAMKCPVDLVFNARRNRCDWNSNVDCGNRTISEPEENDNGDGQPEEDEDDNTGPGNDDPAKAAEICAETESNGVLVAHEYCNWYYTCWDGQPIAMKCPVDLVFNARRNRCDWNSNVDCGNRTISEPEENDNGDGQPEEDEDDSTGPGNDDPAKAAEICAETESNGVLVAHEYCNWYYTCWDGQPIAMKCPVDLVFNARRNRCDWNSNVDCGNRTISEPEENDNGDGQPEEDEDDSTGPGNDDPAKAAEICAETESNGVLVAHEYCNWYYTCWDGQPIAMKCPVDLVFNARRNRCDWNSNVDCGNRTISEPEENDNGDGNDDENNEDEEDNGPINDNPAEAAAICAQNNTDGVLVAHENCDEFYICNLYAPLPVRCGRGLLYNPRNKRCDWPENVDCGDRVVPERNDTQSEVTTEEPCRNCDPSEASDICALEGSEGVLVAHENCNQYYKCLGGRPSVQRCMNSLWYNAQKGWCDWPEQVDCGDRIIPGNEDDDSDTIDAIDFCARSGTDGLLVAHEQCNQYYKCSHGQAFELECQSGLLYNPTIRSCDWPANVDCGDRQQ